MANPVDFNPNLANGTFGFEEWNAVSSDFVMDSWNKVMAFKYKTPAFGATPKTVDKLWINCPRIVGDPKWMIQFFANDVDDNNPLKNTFLGALHGTVFNVTHRNGIDVVKGWNTIQVNGDLKNNGYPYPSGYPTTIVALTLSQNTEYWILIAPQKDTAEGYTKSNTKNYAVLRALGNYIGPLYRMKTMWTARRSGSWNVGTGVPNPYKYSATGESLILPFAVEYTDGTTKHGMPYVQTGWKSSYDAKPGYDITNPLGLPWRTVSSAYSQQQLFVAPSLGIVKQLEFRTIWGTPTAPTADLRARLFPSAGGANLFDEIVCPKNDPWMKAHANINYARVRVTFDTGFTMTAGTNYVLEFYSTTSTTRPWWMLAHFTGSVNAVIRGLKFGGATTYQHRSKFGGAAAITLSNQDSDMTFTMATIPASLTGITAAYDAANRRNHVTWTGSIDALHDHYKIFRKKSTEPDTEYELLADSVPGASYDDYALASGVLYQYRVSDVRT